MSNTSGTVTSTPLTGTVTSTANNFVDPNLHTNDTGVKRKSLKISAAAAGALFKKLGSSLSTSTSGTNKDERPLSSRTEKDTKQSKKDFFAALNRSTSNGVLTDDEEDVWGFVTTGKDSPAPKSPRGNSHLSPSSSITSIVNLENSPISPRGSTITGSNSRVLFSAQTDLENLRGRSNSSTTSPRSENSSLSLTPPMPSIYASATPSPIDCSDLTKSTSNEHLPPRIRARGHSFGSLHGAIDQNTAHPPLFPTEVFEEGIVLIVEPNGVQRVRGGTLEKLVEKLTSDKFLDPNFLIEFLLTYRAFTTPQKLLELLVARYNIKAPEGASKDEEEKFNKQVLTPIRFRVLNVVRRWVGDQWNDFATDTQLKTKLMEFLDVASKSGNEKIATTIRTTMERKLSKQVDDIEITSRVPTPRIPSGISTGELKLLDIHPEEIARQITLIERDQFSTIDVTRECVNQTWTKREHEARPLLSTIEWFNKMSQWSCSEIVRQSKMDQRVRFLEHMIAIAEGFYNLNNINGVMEIVSGLSKNPLHRLQGTWKELSTKVQKAFIRLDKLVSAENNYCEMRTHLRTITPPCIPYLGLYLRDIVFIEDGNSSELAAAGQTPTDPSHASGSTFINFEKHSMVGQLLRQIVEYQKTPYNLEPVPALQEFLRRNINEALPEEELYNLSLEIVPRGGYTKGKKHNEVERDREKEKEKQEKEQQRERSRTTRSGRWSRKEIDRVVFNSNDSGVDSSDSEMDAGLEKSLSSDKELMEVHHQSVVEALEAKIELFVDAKLDAFLDQKLSSSSTRLEQLVNAKVEALVNTKLESLVEARINDAQSSLMTTIQRAQQQIDEKLALLHKQQQLMMEMWANLTQLRQHLPEAEFRKLMSLAQEMKKLDPNTPNPSPSPSPSPIRVLSPAPLKPPRPSIIPPSSPTHSYIQHTTPATPSTPTTPSHLNRRPT